MKTKFTEFTMEEIISSDSFRGLRLRYGSKMIKETVNEAYEECKHLVYDLSNDSIYDTKHKMFFMFPSTTKGELITRELLLSDFASYVMRCETARLINNKLQK